MSKSLTRISDIKSIKLKFLDLIASGSTETSALKACDMTRGQFMRACDEDPDFIKKLEECRKARAEHWVSKIADTVDEDFSKDEVPSEKLKLDKLMFLAKADNPDRYKSSGTKVDLNIDLKQFKLLAPEEAAKALASDPFAIEVEFETIPDEELL